VRALISFVCEGEGCQNTARPELHDIEECIESGWWIPRDWIEVETPGDAPNQVFCSERCRDSVRPPLRLVQGAKPRIRLHRRSAS
jgi:hypothetical protein